ncbi:MAG: hypothetical protein HC916_02940 [Coleofasciculaceae cyanobacterium SM2_1_6]|nr:hypothetical protein [Coleofasciculaceae cyanobacterium SM2_1_6]
MWLDRTLVSQKITLILAEANITSIVGMIRSGAGLVFPYGLAIAHMYFER